MFKMDVFVPALIAAIVLLPQAAGAAEVASSQRIASRYVMEKTAGGIVRMDTATGAMTFCREDKGKLSCTMPNDEREVLERRLAGLEARVSKLEASLAALKGQAQPLPSGKELDRAMNTFDHLMRHFFKMVQNLNKDLQNEPKKQDNSATSPQRT